MSEFKDFYYPSCTGKNSIHARICYPASDPIGIIQIVHGIAEYIERYDAFMIFLADHGYIAVGEDHLGHGKSFTKMADRGFFCDTDGWNCVVNDIESLHDIIASEYPDIPYVFFGHSMGSFLTRTFIIDHPEKYTAAIISGTGHQLPAMVVSGYTMAEAAVKLYGPHKIGYRLNQIAFGSYCKKIENPKTEFDWLSRDSEIVSRYAADPLCGFTPTVSLFRDMMSGIRYLTNPVNLSRMNKDKPLYLMSGAEDPVGEYGKGVERAYKSFIKAGVIDVTMKLYPGGRHEMLNELNKEEVYKDILNWLSSRL